MDWWVYFVVLFVGDWGGYCYVWVVGCGLVFDCGDGDYGGMYGCGDGGVDCCYGDSVYGLWYV